MGIKSIYEKYLTVMPGRFPAIFQNGLLFVFALLGLSYYVFFRRNNSKIRIPGPGMPNILGGLTNVLALSDKKKTLQVFENWCATYGPIFTFYLGPYKLFALNSPEYIQKLLSSTEMDHLGKGFAYNPFKPHLKDGLLLSKGEKWKFRRRVLEKHMFSFKTLLSYMTTLNKETDNFLHKIGERFASRTEQRIDNLLMSYTLEVVTSAAFGKTLAEMESMTNCNLNITNTVNRAKEIIITRSCNPWLLSDFIWRFHPMSKMETGVLKSLKIIGDTTLTENPTIPGKKHREGIKHDLAAAGVPVEGIFEESLTLLTGGYDSTAGTLQFLLLFLALHPEHQERCREEVDLVFEDVDLCPSGQLQFRALRELKYLEMCVNETLRLLPTIFFFMRKIEKPLILEENLVLDAGSEVVIFVQGLHKNPKYFPNPQKFNPERFSETEIKTRPAYSFIPFSGGPRKCIGYKFAMMMILSLSAKLLRDYVLDTKEKLEDIVFLPNVSITPEKPIKFLIRKRVNKQMAQ